MTFTIRWVVQSSFMVLWLNCDAGGRHQVQFLPAVLHSLGHCAWYPHEPRGLGGEAKAAFSKVRMRTRMSLHDWFHNLHIPVSEDNEIGLISCYTVYVYLTPHLIILPEIYTL